MKRALILAAMAALMCSCTNKTRFVIEGTAENANATAYLFDDNDEIIDSTAIENGSFRFTGKVERPMVCTVSDDREEPTFTVRLFLEPGTIVIADDQGTPTGKSATGTPANDASTALLTETGALIAEAMDPETSEERNAEIGDEYEKLIRDTYEANRQNYLGVMLLAQQLSYEMSGEEILDEIATFSPELQQSRLMTDLKARAEKKKLTDIGQPYIDIVQPTPDGKEVSLKSVVETPGTKYVLLDFWASWCGPCMHEVPFLTKTYADFHKKGFEIYGVSFDNDRKEWTGAIAENGMKWVNVSTLEYFNNPAAEPYAVQAIPTNFLIDSDGRIVAHNLRGDDLYNKIKELLGE